jgi:hypothetical protein
MWLSAVVGTASSPPPEATDAIELRRVGTITGIDHQRFRAVEFEVPTGIDRLDVDFSHDGQGVRTVVDLALYDGEGFRGASGSNKTALTIGSVDATPSYLPGPIRSGTWRLVMGFPNVRAAVGLPGRGMPPTNYEVRIRLHRKGHALPESAFVAEALRREAGWYRGDFHAHTAHSDGTCESRKGRRVPCPMFKTLLAVDREALDFIAITDHNTNSHYNGLRELQAYFDQLLIIPGMEMTTFGGHANVLGIDQWPAFLKPDASVADVAAVFSETRRRRGLVIVNHPGLPSNEDCMGCGWSGQAGWNAVDAVEIVNGGSLLRFASAEGPYSALEYWQRLLDLGVRVTAIAGSDSHDPAATADRQVPVGRPRTVVYAPQLSQRALFTSVREARAFVDVDGTQSRHIDLSVVTATQNVVMGGSVELAPKTDFSLEVATRDVLGQQLIVTIGDLTRGRVAHSNMISSDVMAIKFKTTGCERWLRADVREAVTGRLLLISNPIYFATGSNSQPACNSPAEKI